MKKKLWTLLMLLLMVLGSFLFAFKPAAAQTVPTVYLSPEPANVYLNGSNSQVVDIMIAGAANLISFDIKLTYDASISTIQSVAFGSFFEVGGCVKQTNTPGFLWYSCFQFGSSSPKSAGGIILKLTFKGQSAGTTPLTFTRNEMSDVDNKLIIATPTNGTLNVTYNATIKLTTLSGNFDLQGRTDRGGIPVNLSKGQYTLQGPYTKSTTEVNGNNLAFTNVAMDLYTVTTNQPRYLNIDATCGKTKAVLGTTSTLSPLKLKGGNAEMSDNEINIYDITKITGVYGKASTLAAPLEEDINANGTVDVYDLAMAAGNYGLTCATAYANWVP